MDSLIYSLNATLPVFLVIVVGYVLKQIGILNDGFVKTANKFNFVVTLPVLLFVDLSTTDIIGDFDIKYVLYCALVTTVAFFGLWIAAKFLIKDKKIVGEFVQAGYRSSAAILGVAFIQNIYGDSGMAPVMIIGCVPLFNIFAVLVLTFEGKKDGNGKGNIINSLINIVKNPIIIGIVLGVAASLLKIDFHNKKPASTPRNRFYKLIQDISCISVRASVSTISRAFASGRAVSLNRCWRGPLQVIYR